MFRYTLGLILFLQSELLFGAVYSLADLKALHSEKNYLELLDHAFDVRPAKRNDEWKNLIKEAGEILVGDISKQKDIPPKVFKKLIKYSQYPLLLKSETYPEMLNQIAITYFENCLSKKTPCLRELQGFWKTLSIKSSDFCFKISQILFQNQQKDSVWTYLRPALLSPLSEFYCKKDFVKAEIFNYFSKAENQGKSEDELLKLVDQTLHHDCLPAFNSYLLAAIYNPRSIIEREIAFNLMNAQGKADNSLKDFFFSIFLLENPSKGDLFNLAWNKMNELKKSPERRDKVIEQVSKMDFFPDDLFKSSDKLKIKTILSHLKNGFPELIDLYIAQCLAYYEGKRAFPKGNPTANCQFLMQHDFVREFIAPGAFERFQKTRRF